jgi:hypothetical protein
LQRPNAHPLTPPKTRGPGLKDVSFSLFKTFQSVSGCVWKHASELFNTVNYDNPNVTFSPNRQGQNVNANFGRITGALDARRMQLGLRLAF